MISIIHELRADNSSNYKLDVLRKHSDNEVFKKVLWYTYNTELNYWIKKIPITNVNSTDEDNDFNRIFDHLERLRTRTITGNQAIHETYNLLCNLTVENARILELILKRDLGCNISTKSINKVFPGLIPTTPYMRCSKLDEKTINTFPDGDDYLCQLKADGAFTYIIRDVENNKVYGKTRNGSTWSSERLTNVMKNNSYNSFVLMGEALIIMDKESDITFDRKTGNGMIFSFMQKDSTLATLEDKYQEAVNKRNVKLATKIQKEIKEKIEEFKDIEDRMVFDVWDVIDLNSFKNGYENTTYYQRFEDARKIIRSINEISKENIFRIISSDIVTSVAEAQEIGQQYIDSGFEGAILKRLDAPYEDGTSKMQVKIKAILDADLLCVDVEEGTGKNVGKVGALVLESKCGKLRTKVGTGLKDIDREKPFDYYKSKVIEVNYNEVIKSKGKDTYSLFLPVFVEVREDKNDYNTLEELK